MGEKPTFDQHYCMAEGCGVIIDDGKSNNCGLPGHADEAARMIAEQEAGIPGDMETEE